MWGLLVPTSMSLLILPVSLDTYKNLTPGFLLLSNYLLLSPVHVPSFDGYTKIGATPLFSLKWEAKTSIFSPESKKWDKNFSNLLLRRELDECAFSPSSHFSAFRFSQNRDALHNTIVSASLVHPVDAPHWPGEDV